MHRSERTSQHLLLTLRRNEKLQVGESESSELSSGLISSPCYHDYGICQSDNCFPDQVTSHLAAGLADLHPAKEARSGQTTVHPSTAPLLGNGNYLLAYQHQPFSNLYFSHFSFFYVFFFRITQPRLFLNSPCSQGWPRTLCPCVFTSQELELGVHTITPSPYFSLQPQLPLIHSYKSAAQVQTRKIQIVTEQNFNNIENYKNIKC